MKSCTFVHVVDDNDVKKGYKNDTAFERWGLGVVCALGIC